MRALATDLLAWRRRANALMSAGSVDARATDDSGTIYAAALFGLCFACVWVVRDKGLNARVLGSYALQHAVFWGSFWLFDRQLLRGLHRGLWAGFGAVCAALFVLDALLMRMTSLPLREILPMLLASQHVVEGLREIGLKPLRLVLLGVLLLLAAVGGGGIRLAMADLLPRRRRRIGSALPGLALSVLAMSFCAEQAQAREDPDYLYRGLRLPLYLQLYETSSRSVELALPPPVEHSTRARWLSHVQPARNPRHVLYVLLESFRADALDPQAAPSMWQLAEQSLWYTHALAEATYTPLSWSVLLFDEAAADNLFGRHSGRPEPLGGFLLAVMRRAGLQPHLFVSTNLSYAHTRQRLEGDGIGLDLFQAAAEVGDDPLDKNTNDRVAVDHAVEFIREQAWTEPQFILLQLDSTHYTYPFPEQQAVFAPYSENLILPRPIETEHEAQLLHNRYRNAVHFVDAQLARVLKALREAGVYDDTLIVLTADHGEGLAPGLQGHAAVAEPTKHVPLLLRIPGQPAARVDTLVSHRDILPTLTRLLGINLPAGAMRGRSLDQRTDNAVFTLAPSGRFGQLSLRDYVVDLRLVFKAESVIVTPAGIHRSAGSEEPSPMMTQGLWLPRLAEFMQDSQLAGPEAPARSAAR